MARNSSNVDPNRSSPHGASRHASHAAMLFALKLSQSEVSRAFAGAENPYGPILSLKEAAALAKLAPGTLKRLVSEGQFADSVRRGKPLRFWRDRFVAELMR